MIQEQDNDVYVASLRCFRERRFAVMNEIDIGFQLNESLDYLTSAFMACCVE